MLYMTHYEDKHGTHHISFKYLDDNKNKTFSKEKLFGEYGDNGFVQGTDITDLMACGPTKEAAIKNAGEIIDYLIDELNAIKKLYNWGTYEDEMVEVDGLGNVIKEGSK